MTIRLLSVAALLIVACIIIITPKIPGFIDDIYCWINWADAIRQHGLSNVYDTDTNYLPVYHYVLWLYAQFAPDREFLIAHSHWLRYFTLAVDIIGLWLLYKWTDRKFYFPLIIVISLLNIAYVYDNIIWGQVDGILAVLAFAALYCAYERRYILGAICISIMINFKLQGIIFIPLYGMILLAQNDFKKWPKHLLKSAIVLICMEVLILFPFMLKDGGVTQVYHTLKSLVGYVPKVSSLAFNSWTFVLGSDADITPDGQVIFAGLTYKQLGLLMFGIGSYITLWPLLDFILKKRTHYANRSFPKEYVWLMAALLALLFFYCNTQMHERYSYPAFIFIAAYTFYRKDFIPYILFSCACFMNLEFVLRWLQLDNYNTAIFDRRLVSAIYGIIILYLWYCLYKLYYVQCKISVDQVMKAE